jgi:mRNA interferase MazF
MYFKNFDKWNEVKKQTETSDTKVYIRAGEIRWISVGVNVGSEIDGKGDSFTRPGLVLHVIGSHLALVVPFSTKIKEVPGYFPFEWKGVTTALCIHQLRIVSQKRILSRKGRVSEDRLKMVKDAILKFYNF